MTDRPVPTENIKITPAMLDAGRCELVSFDPVNWNAEETVENIFRAMIEAGRTPALNE